MDLARKPSLTRQVLNHSSATPGLDVYFNMPLSLTMEKKSKSTPSPKIRLIPGFCRGQEVGCGGLHLRFQCSGSKGRRIRSPMTSLATYQVWGQHGLHETCLNRSIIQSVNVHRSEKQSKKVQDCPYHIQYSMDTKVQIDSGSLSPVVNWSDILVILM